MVFLAFSALCWGCARRATDEELVRAAIQGAIGAAEQRDVSAFMGFVSEDYNDAEGNDFKAVKGIALYQFMREKPLRIFVRSLNVEMKEGLAVVDARVAAVRGGAGGGAETLKDALPEDADVMRFNLVMRKEGSRWRVLRASWASMGAAGLL